MIPIGLYGFNKGWFLKYWYLFLSVFFTLCAFVTDSRMGLISLFLVFAFLVVQLYMTFKSVFSKPAESEREQGWGLEDFLPELSRAIWGLFIVDVFMGGAFSEFQSMGWLANMVLVLKVVVLNAMALTLSRLFVRLREDQAESFILWRLTPLSVLILAASLLVSGWHR